MESAVILAGGASLRMRSKSPKPLLKVLDEPMLEWVISACLESGVERICVVSGYEGHQVEEYIEGREGILNKGAGGYESVGTIDCVRQKEQGGTGHAVLQALDFIRKGEGHTLILNGDMPFIDSKTIEESLKSHKSSGSAMTLITVEGLDCQKGSGAGGLSSVVLGAGGGVIGLNEGLEGHSGCYGGAAWFKNEDLEGVLPLLPNNPKTGESYITDAIYILNDKGLGVSRYVSRNQRAVLGADTKLELHYLNELARKQVIEELMEAGVEFSSLDGVIIGRRVRVGEGTAIQPGVILRGNTAIGEDCVIGPNTLLEDCVVGDEARLNAVQAYESVIGKQVSAGPFCHLRPGTHLEEGVKLGDFVEIKNSTIGAHTAVAHLTYLGDSDVGSHCNFGCGCVTANYDGQEKHRTQVGDEAFLGCHTRLIAPVKVGKRVYTAAGTTVTKDIPDGALAIERGEVRIRPGYGERRIKKHEIKK